MGVKGGQYIIIPELTLLVLLRNVSFAWVSVKVENFVLSQNLTVW